jgi:putative transposase
LGQASGRVAAFYNFPAEHWKHLGTTNPKLIRNRPPRNSCAPKEVLSNNTALAIIFKLGQPDDPNQRRKIREQLDTDQRRL